MTPDIFLVLLAVAAICALVSLSVAITVVRRDEAMMAGADKMEDAVSRMASELQNIVSQVRSSASAIETASDEIASGNVDLSQRTEEQASNLEMTAASMEQLSTTVQHNAENARQANQLARDASAVAARGGEAVSKVVDTMKGISDSSRRVADIIGVIDSIAFQTNILALNAAVEAARAGEQGRGFAVVASEVRTLAQRSAEAAKEIKVLIGSSVDKVDTGSRLVQDAGSTIQEVVASIRRVSDIVDEISSSSIEQTAGVLRVGEAVHMLDVMTQQNAALVEESAAAAESLREHALKLTGLVGSVQPSSAGAVSSRAAAP